MTRVLVRGLVVLLALSLAGAADPPPSQGDATPIDHELEAIRDQLVALDIEKALAAVRAILERPDLSEATRVAALDLRAQAHVASDDLDAAEKDYRAILELSAGYEPGRDVTSKKAMDRFVRTRAAMIGTVHLDVDPKDATLAVDGRTVSVPADGDFPAVAGVRHLRLARKGFDMQDVDVHAVAGEETLVRIRLVPNARSLVVRTDVDGVAVAVDGVPSGVTARGSDAGSDAEAAAILLIEDVPIGEHEILLTKLCFATESLQEIVSVDLADRTPKVTRIVAMRPARTRVTATGARYEGELRIDGERAATLPLTAFETCPGVRTVEVVASGRIVWSSVLDAEESDLTIDLAPRPNVVVVGADWPKTWAAVLSQWSLRGRVDSPPGADLTTSEGWSAVSLPPATDMAVGVMPHAGIAGEDLLVLFGPSLQVVEDRVSPPLASRPTWTRATLGVSLVDAGQGTVVLASVTPQGPAARSGLLPGDRLLAISGRSVANASSAKDAIVAAGIGVTLELDIAAPSGPVRKVPCATSPEPVLTPPHGDEPSRVVRAAWASVEAAAGGPGAAIPLANLAVLLERSGQDSAALEAWRRVRAIGGGTLAARAAYASGAGLQADGKGVDAIEAFGQAKSEALANGDTPLAAAAIDRLADLGVAPR